MSNEIKQETADILVSVVVPVYNVEPFLRQCVDSLLSQTHTNLEIILVDDGSTDSSGVICDEYAARSNSVRVIHKQNGGLSSARNAGIAEAQGAYIGFVDSDDFVEANMYALLLDAAITQDAQIAVCGRYVTDEEGNVLREQFAIHGGKLYGTKEALSELLAFGELDVSVCDKLFRKDIAEGICFPVGEINEDAAVIFKAISGAVGLVHIGEPMYYYRGRNGSITKSGYKPNKIQALEHAQTITEFVCAQFPELKTQTRQYMAYTCCGLLSLMLKYPEAKKQYPDHYARYSEGLRKNIWQLYNNPNISWIWKLRGTMIYLNLYEILYKILKNK